MRDPRTHCLRAAQILRPLAKAGREPVEGALCARTAAARNTPTERQAQPSGPPRPAQPASGGPPARAAQRARRAAPRRYTGGAAPHLGSVLRAVNVADSSDVAFAAEYTTFGEQTVTTGSADFVPFGFAGGLSDAQTALVRFGARDYDPVVGRWISKDPILFDGGQANLYVYVGNDPINALDPNGMAAGDLLRCLLGGGTLAGCLSDERDRFCNGPFGALCDPPEPPPSEPGKCWDHCPPCEGDLPEPEYHYDHPHGECEDHWHYYEFHQSPKTCKCSMRRRFGGCL